MNTICRKIILLRTNLTVMKSKTYQKNQQAELKQLFQQISFTYLLFENVRIDALRSIHHRNTDTNDDSHRGSLANQAFQLANAAYKKGDFEGGLQHYATALKNSYQSHEIHNNIGVLRALRKQFKLAVESLKIALELKPSQTISIINLANVYLRNDKYEQGITLYLQMMKINNSSRVQSHFNQLLKILNSFRKFYQSYLNTCLSRINPQQSILLTKRLLNNINYSTPIILFPKLKTDSGGKLKTIIDKLISFYPKLPYVAMKDIDDQIQINKLYDEVVAEVADPHLIQISCLIMGYYFNQKNQPSIAMYFFSLIDKFQNTEIKHSYLTLHQNFKQIQSQMKISLQKQENNIDKIGFSNFYEFQKAFYRFQIYQKLIMFWFHENLDRLKDKQLPQNIDKIIPLISQIKPMHYLYFYFNYSGKDKVCQFKDAIKILIYNLYEEIQINESKQKAHKKLNQIILQKYNNHTIYRAYQQKCFLHFRYNQIDEALQTLKEAQQAYPQKNDIWDCCYGSIYLSLNNLKQSITYFKSSLRQNSMNQKSNYIYGCICMRYRSHKVALKYLFNAIQINPSFLEYYLVFAFCYDVLLQEQSNKILSRLYQIPKHIPKNIQFKVKGNIAIFHLYVRMYRESYQYLCTVLKDGGNQIDYSGEDLSLIYYYRMLLQVFNVYHSQYFQCQIQCSFYLLILKESHILKEKYILNIQSPQQISSIYIQISSIILQNLSNSCKRQIIFKHITKFTEEHKYTIYHHIFELVLQGESIDPLDMFQYFIRIQEGLSKAIWVLEIQSRIKQARIQSLIKFITPSKLSLKQRSNYLLKNTQFNNLSLLIQKLKNKKYAEQQIQQLINSYKDLKVKCCICTSIFHEQKCIYQIIHQTLNILLQTTLKDDIKISDDSSYFEHVNNLYLFLQSLHFSSHEIALLTYQILHKQFTLSSILMNEFKNILKLLIKEHQYEVFKQNIEKLLDQQDNNSSKSSMSLFNQSLEEQSLVGSVKDNIISNDRSHEDLINNYLKQNGFKSKLCQNVSFQHLLDFLFQLEQLSIILKDTNNISYLTISQLTYSQDMLVVNIQQNQLFQSSQYEVKKCKNQQLSQLFYLIHNQKNQCETIQQLLCNHREKITLQLIQKYKFTYNKPIYSKQLKFYYSLLEKKKINWNQFWNKMSIIRKEYGEIQKWTQKLQDNR